MYSDSGDLGLLRREQFKSYESGNIIAGIKHSIRTDLGLETHECYQFDTLQGLIDVATDLMERDDVEKVEIVTHSGGYKNMRTLFRWDQSNIGTDPDTDPRFAQ